MRGRIVCSKAGRDKDKFLVIVDESKETFSVVDGKERPLERPKVKNKKEAKYGDIIYRENDKVLQLVNDPDNNIFNGDIGYIKHIDIITKPKKLEIFTIDFDGNEVMYQREDLINITLK